MGLSPLYVNRSTVINFTSLPRPQLHMVFIEHWGGISAAYIIWVIFNPSPCVSKQLVNKTSKTNITACLGIESTLQPCFEQHIALTNASEKLFLSFVHSPLFYTEINYLQYNSFTCHLQRLQFHSIKPAAPCPTSKASIAGWLERLLPDVWEQKTIQKHFYMLKTRYPTVQGLFVLDLAKTAF